MPTDNPRIFITLPLDTYLSVVEHAAVGGRSVSKQGRMLIESALKFQAKPDYQGALQAVPDD